MAHHTRDGPFDDDDKSDGIRPMERTYEEMQRIKALMSESALSTAKQAMVGPTNTYPDGRLGRHDEGALTFRVGAMKDDAGRDKVVIDFGTPVHSVGMTPEQALELGRLLITRAGYMCTVEIPGTSR